MVERSKGSQLGGTYEVQAVVETITATNDNEVMVWKNNTGAPVKITKAGFVPEAALSGADTNNMTLQFKSKTAAGVAAANVTAVKTYDSGTDLVAFSEDALVLSTTAADLRIEDGESVTLDKAENGTGAALPAGIATLTYQFDG